MSTMGSNANKVVQVWEVLEASDTARSAYQRVLAQPTRLEVAKNVICLLLWLETIMGVKVLEAVATMESSDIRLPQVVMEADAVYSFLLHAPPEPLESIPTIVALCGGGRLVDLGFFKFHKDLVARGVAVIRDTVAAVVFNDHLHEMMRRFEDEFDSSSPTARPVPDPALMAPFVAQTRTPPEDSRAAFVSFPDGGPLSALDILNYFERRLGFGRCIEHVVMEQPPEGQTAKHGIIVFWSAELREQVMFEETAAFFRVNGRDMWLQVYKPPF